jgi:gas vesicle protein
MARKGNFWLGMIVGAAAGAVTALLYAPKKGDELRHDISDRARDVGRKAGEAWGDMKQKTTDAAGKSREWMGTGQQRIREAVTIGRRAAEEKRKELESELEEKE